MKTLPFSQYCSIPLSQGPQWRQEFTMHPTPTRAPTLNLLTLEPTATTTPASSWPVTSGNGSFRQCSRPWWMSEWQMPQYWSLMATSLGPRARRWNFRSRRGPSAE